MRTGEKEISSIEEGKEARITYKETGRYEKNSTGIREDEVDNEEGRIR